MYFFHLVASLLNIYQIPMLYAFSKNIFFTDFSTLLWIFFSLSWEEKKNWKCLIEKGELYVELCVERNIGIYYYPSAGKKHAKYWKDISVTTTTTNYLKRKIYSHQMYESKLINGIQFKYALRS